MSNNNRILNNYEKSIVKIITLEGRIIGTGFIVTNDGIICTCFHNIGDLDNKEVYNDINVYFPETKQKVKATVLKDEKNSEGYKDPINDIAFLHIQKKDQEELKDNGQELIPLPLSKSVQRLNRFTSRGFRKDDEFKPGLDSHGDIEGTTEYLEIPIIQLSSKQIEAGMSGSPVLDIKTGKIIGMIFANYPKKNNTDPDLVMAIPVKSIIHLYEKLSEKNPGLNLRFSESPVIEKILNNYADSLEKKVSQVRLLGGNKDYDLNEVFVDLIINEEYDRPSFSFQSLDQYKGMMDSELRRKRFLFSDKQKEEDDQTEERREKENKIRKIKPGDLLTSNKKTTIIVGAPGSGKSTLMRYLVHKTLQQKEKDYFPVYLELKKIQIKEVNDKDRFEDIIFSEAIISPLIIDDNENEKSLLKVLKDKLRDGKVAFFLDGLDEMKEVGNSQNSVSLRNLFNKFVESEYINNNLVIVTTRPYALQGGFDTYRVQEMEIAPFDIGQIKQFIIHYFGDNNPGAKRFLDALSTRTEIQELARVPSILGFLLLMYIESKSLSENKLDVYDNIVTSLNKQLDEGKKDINRNFKIPNPIHRLKILTSLAFSGLLNFHYEISNRLVFSGDKIYTEVEKYCTKNSNLNLNTDDLFEDIKITALLREIGNDKYAFSHLTIQEYLASKILIKDENLGKLFFQAYFDPTICEMEVLPMTIGMYQSRTDNTTVNLYELLEKLPESLNFANFRLRVKGLGYSPRMVDEKYLSHIADRLINFVTEKNIEDTNYKEIIFNVFSGLFAENRKYISLRLLELLEKHDQLKSIVYIENLIYVLGKVNDKESITALVNLLKDEDFDVRSSAARALTGTQDKDAISRMVDLLKDDNWSVRSSIAMPCAIPRTKTLYPEWWIF
jgi:GTPase SAR1 family protein